MPRARVGGIGTQHSKRSVAKRRERLTLRTLRLLAEPVESTGQNLLLAELAQRFGEIEQVPLLVGAVQCARAEEQRKLSPAAGHLAICQR